VVVGARARVQRTWDHLVAQTTHVLAGMLID
jgi:hypothetical protein